MREQGRSPFHPGCRPIELIDPVQGVRIPLHVLYPTDAPTREARFAPYSLEVAMDGPVVGERLSLVVISHGTGGSPWTYRDLAAGLARAGFVVGLPEHPGNNRNDNRLAGTAENLENRPRHLRLVIDAILADSVIGPHLSDAGVAVIGHSQGGYTGLALAGGKPNAGVHETPDKTLRPVPVQPDPRVRALVLLAPATPWYAAEGALSEVDLPILLRTGEKDEHAPPVFADVIKRGVRNPARIDHQVIPNAGHFSFQSPFPAPMVSPSFPPSQDPPGFDRVAYLSVLIDDVRSFLERELRT